MTMTRTTAVKGGRNIPLPSLVIINFMNIIYAVAYVILKPMGLAPAAIAFQSGGLFGALLLPVAVLYVLLFVLRQYVVPTEAEQVHEVIFYSLWGFVVWYVWTIVTDDCHLRVEDTCFRQPQTIFDRLSYDLFKELFEYFPISCVPQSDKVKQQLTPDKQYVFGVHPHGIHCFPLALLASNDTPFDKMFPGITSGSTTTVPKHPLTGLAATIMFKIPVVREFFLSFGYVDARRDVADAVLRDGKSVFVCTGGEEESMYAGSVGDDGKEDVLVLKNRKGFVRLALRHGADLVPIYGPGNEHVFQTYGFARGFRCWIQKTFRVALPVFHGRCFTPLPYSVPLRVIVGEPIATPKPTRPGDKPDEKLVEEYHQKYISALKDIHSQHVRERPLRII